MYKSVLLIIFLFIGCSSVKDSIFIEKIPKSLEKDENRFDRDNKIYTIGKELLFAYSMTRNDKSIPSDLKFIKLNIIGGTKPFSKYHPDYSQTVIEYLYLDNDHNILAEEKTGLVENKKNIWFHPPRDQDTGILQLSAFPYVKFNNKKMWQWDLQAAYSSYESEVFKHAYIQGDEVDYESSFGSISCTSIQAETISSNGKSSSNFLYNNKYGFVMMEFLNIDETKITLKLIK